MNTSSDCQVYLQTILPSLYGYNLTQAPGCCDGAATVCNTKQQLTKMQVPGLYLNNNSIGQGIPSEWSNMGSLAYLHLEFNNLDGPIPAELATNAKLIDLFLNDNYLNGTVPSALGTLPNLVQLYLQRNYLQGDLGFVSKVPNSTYVFAPQNTPPVVPNSPSSSPSFSPILLPALLSALGLVLVVGAVLVTFYRQRRLRKEQESIPLEDAPPTIIHRIGSTETLNTTSDELAQDDELDDRIPSRLVATRGDMNANAGPSYNLQTEMGGLEIAESFYSGMSPPEPERPFSGLDATPATADATNPRRKYDE
ncbi:hypothetical protein HDU91_005081 [Kappamyces sp. JEL0680]|nr:hypothetical protein HDU91_005081 [Kappamyces sp. JEL0680]